MLKFWKKCPSLSNPDLMFGYLQLLGDRPEMAYVKRSEILGFTPPTADNQLRHVKARALLIIRSGVRIPVANETPADLEKRYADGRNMP